MLYYLPEKNWYFFVNLIEVLWNMTGNGDSHAHVLFSLYKQLTRRDNSCVPYQCRARDVTTLIQCAARQDLPEVMEGFYIWHCVPNILLWSILCKTVGLPSSTGESERTARRQLHSPTLRCFRGHLCEVAAGRGPLKQSRWAESNWTLPLRSVGVAPSLGRFWLVFAALKLRYVLRRHIILSDSDGNQAVLDCFTVSPGLGGSAK